MPNSETIAVLQPFFGVIGVFVASMLYRKLSGKPVLFFGLKAAKYVEWTASGHSNDNLLRQLGGASNCLVVAVVDNRLIVRPFFPFNLFFLPEIYGLEHDIDLTNVVSVRSGRTLWRKKLIITFLDAYKRHRSLTLYLKNPDGLARLVE